jgi:hypothetical protein
MNTTARSEFPGKTGSHSPSVARIFNWKPYQRNTLRGFFSVELPSGLVIHKCTLHVKANSRWIGFPAERYKKSDGEVGYAILLEFRSRDIADRFRDVILAAFDAQVGTRA